MSDAKIEGAPPEALKPLLLKELSHDLRKLIDWLNKHPDYAPRAKSHISKALHPLVQDVQNHVEHTEGSLKELLAHIVELMTPQRAIALSNMSEGAVFKFGSKRRKTDRLTSGVISGFFSAIYYSRASFDPHSHLNDTFRNKENPTLRLVADCIKFFSDIFDDDPSRLLPVSHGSETLRDYLGISHEDHEL